METTARIERSCAECGSAGAIEHGICQVCGATGAADLPPAAPPAPRSLPPPVRFTDVIVELERISAMAERIGGPNAHRAALMCRRVEGMLRSLRDQFVVEVASQTGSRGRL